MSTKTQLKARLAEVDAEIAEADRQLEAALIASGATGAIRDYLQAARRERADTVAAIEAARAEAAAAGEAEIDAAAAEIVQAIVERARAEVVSLVVPMAPRDHAYSTRTK